MLDDIAEDADVETLIGERRAFERALADDVDAESDVGPRDRAWRVLDAGDVIAARARLDEKVTEARADVEQPSPASRRRIPASIPLDSVEVAGSRRLLQA